MCVAVFGDELTIIILDIEVTKGMWLRVQTEYVASINFVRRQSLQNSRLKYFERKTPSPKISVRLASDTSECYVRNITKMIFLYLIWGEKYIWGIVYNKT